MPLRPMGRRVSPVDARDHAYRMAALRPSPATSRMWPFGVPPFDQGTTPQCVAYAWMACLLAGPVRTPLTGSATGFAAALYREAQTLDNIPGVAYDGTTVRGAAKALKARGLLSGYVWGTTTDDVVQHLLTRGPVVLGVNWYRGMSEVSGRGSTMHGTGALEGGHAVLAIGVSASTRAVRILNSWGPTWGHGGRAWMPFALLDRLLAEDGEACSPMEIRR